MNKDRASIFDSDDMDLSGFAPKTGPAADAPPAEKVRAVAEAANFPSRQPAPRRPKVEPKSREQRRHRTGRNLQINVKATQETIDALYTISDRQGWVLGETLERALAALQETLRQDGR